MSPAKGEEEEDFPTPSFPVIFRHPDSFADADLARRQEAEEEEDEITPAIFVKDPAEWIRFVDKLVRVKTNNGDVVEGVVRVIDPVSEAVVIARRTNCGKVGQMGVDGGSRDDGTRTDDVKENARVQATDAKESPPKSRLSVEIIPGHIIEEISVVSEAEATILNDLERLFGENDFSDSAAKILTEEELTAKRDEVRDWLTANRIPVEIGGVKGDVIQVAGKALIIKPPYDVQRCFSLNEIILKKVQQLLRNRESGVERMES